MAKITITKLTNSPNTAKQNKRIPIMGEAGKDPAMMGIDIGEG